MRPVTLLPLLVVLAPGVAAAAAAQEAEAPPPPLTIEAVEIEPAAPGPDTLCQLRVRIRNGGQQDVSSLHFAVTVGGTELPVYRNQLFMQALPPGETSEVRLYNFWTTETGRPAPAGGKLTVEVTLDEARWLEIEQDDEGVEVWQPLGPVPGLPVKGSLTVSLASSPKTSGR